MMRAPGGFTIVELLIVVAVIGVLAVAAVPTLLSAVARGRQKRTMADVRTVAVAVETYATDEDQFPVHADGSDVAVLEEALEPTYTKSLPTVDAWGAALRYSSADGSEYTLVSYGKDRVPSGPASGPTTDFRHDSVFSTGSFITWPVGAQD